MTTTERNTLTTALISEIGDKLTVTKLTGSDKQIAWADTIRRDYIESRVNECNDAHDMYVIKLYAEWMISTHTDAKYWIDNRNNAAMVKRDTMREFGKTLDRAVLMDKSIVYTVPEQTESAESAAEDATESANPNAARIAQLKAERDQLAAEIAALPPIDPDDDILQMCLRGSQYWLMYLQREIDELQAAGGAMQ